MAWLRLAFGNLRVNRRRTAITLLSVAVGVGGLVVLWAFLDGINAQTVSYTHLRLPTKRAGGGGDVG